MSRALAVPEVKTQVRASGAEDFLQRPRLLARGCPDVDVWDAGARLEHAVELTRTEGRCRLASGAFGSIEGRHGEERRETTFVFGSGTRRTLDFGEAGDDWRHLCAVPWGSRRRWAGQEPRAARSALCLNRGFSRRGSRRVTPRARRLFQGGREPGEALVVASRRCHARESLRPSAAWLDRGRGDVGAGRCELQRRWGRRLRGGVEVRHARPCVRGRDRALPGEGRGKRRDHSGLASLHDDLSSRGWRMEDRPPPRRSDHRGSPRRVGSPTLGSDGDLATTPSDESSVASLPRADRAVGTRCTRIAARNRSSTRWTPSGARRSASISHSGPG